jgi:hypothetical protein
MMKRLFLELYRDFNRRDYFQEAFGYSCVDAGEVSGNLGKDIEAQILRLVRKPDMWPIFEKCEHYSEDDLFDITEFLYDYVSKPVDGFHHTYAGCGWHYDTFDKESGREEFRNQINGILRDYQDGFELSREGEVLTLAEPDLNLLYQADLPTLNPSKVEDRVKAAVLKFRRHKSTPDDRRDAIRDLADVLEFIRPQAKQVLNIKDEADLFNLANNFGIRHHNENQKTDYDQTIWYSWMFYYYLATIHACLRLIKKAKAGSAEA